MLSERSSRSRRPRRGSNGISRRPVTTPAVWLAESKKRIEALHPLGPLSVLTITLERVSACEEDDAYP
jgi:hypothetical protein